jgi:hypothetical protein
MGTPPLRLHPRIFIASHKPALVVDIVSPCRGSQASLVANLRAHECAGFESFLLWQINFLGRELSSPPSQYLSDQCSESVSPPLPWASQASTSCERRPPDPVDLFIHIRWPAAWPASLPLFFLDNPGRTAVDTSRFFHRILSKAGGLIKVESGPG